MGLFKQIGAAISNKQSKYTTLYQGVISRGMCHQRSVFHDPADIVTSKFYGGYPDAIYNGSNVELSNKLTLIRAYGTSDFSTVTYPTPPLRTFSFQLEDGTIQVLVDTEAAVYLDNQNGTKTLLYTKGAGAGQSYFTAVGNVVYVGDGVDQWKYTPGNAAGVTWLWGIVAPLAQPNVDIQESGASAVQWTAATVFSTMGFIVDPNGNAQQLYSVNALTTNTTQIGESGDGAPNFNTALGGTTTDGTVTWTCQGPITLWAATTTYQPGAPIYDPATGAIFVMAKSGASASGTTKPRFIDAGSQCLIGSIRDGSASWQCLGVTQKYTPLGENIETNVAVYPWPKNSQIRFYGGRTDSGPNSFYEAALTFPLAPYVTNVGGANELCNGQACYLLGATSGSAGDAGVTANTSYTPWSGVSSQTVGEITTDNDLEWICLGSATWVATTEYEAWAQGTSTFSVIKDSNGNMQVCITAGQSGASAPTWGTGYGQQTADGSATWSCVGSAMSWAANTNWYLPVTGFFPPQPSQPYGGIQITEGGFIQAIVNSGLSGPTAPSWNNTTGGNTTDNAATWLCIGTASPQSLSWTNGHVYASSYKCRAATDYYVTNVPPGLSVPNGPPTGGGTGAISTASPVFTIVGANSGAVNVVSGLGSTDPQVDTIVIWRDADGGGEDNMFELTEIPAPPPKGGKAQPWTFVDYLPDLPTNAYPGLDNLIPAPIDEQNNPPQTGFLPMAWHFQRIWGGLDTNVFFSGGPDVITGNPNEAFNPGDEFPFLSIVTDCIHTSSGLVVVLQDDIEGILGGPSTASFFSTTLVPNKGVLSYNAIDLIGGDIYMFTADSQAIVLSPTLQASRIGFDIGDIIAQWDATKAYITVHDDGVDNAVYLGDGETGYFRLNPHQVPQGTAVWSPFRTVTGGCQMLQSLVTAIGVQDLLIGSTADNKNLLKRDMTVFSDNGTAYGAWYEIGAISLVDAGEVAVVKFIECDFTGVGTIPRLYVALDDPRETPTWVELTSVQNDPPEIYGNTVAPPYYPKRYSFAGKGAKCKRIRFKIDYGTDTVGNELHTFSIFGKREAEA